MRKDSKTKQSGDGNLKKTGASSSSTPTSSLISDPIEKSRPIPQLLQPPVTNASILPSSTEEEPASNQSSWPPTFQSNNPPISLPLSHGASNYLHSETRISAHGYEIPINRRTRVIEEDEDDEDAMEVDGVKRHDLASHVSRLNNTSLYAKSSDNHLVGLGAETLRVNGESSDLAGNVFVDAPWDSLDNSASSMPAASATTTPAIGFVPREDHLIRFIFPSTLPITGHSPSSGTFIEVDGSSEMALQDSGDMEDEESAELDPAVDSHIKIKKQVRVIREGFLGTLRVHASKKTSFELGQTSKVPFQVRLGVPRNMSEQVVVIQDSSSSGGNRGRNNSNPSEEMEAVHIGPVEHTIQLLPDLDAMIKGGASLHASSKKSFDAVSLVEQYLPNSTDELSPEELSNGRLRLYNHIKDSLGGKTPAEHQVKKHS
jgi:RNA polymerase III RPC4